MLEVLGVECGIVRNVIRVTSIGQQPVIPDFWNRELEELRDRNYVTGELMLDIYLRLLVHGRTKETFPDLPYPTMEELREEYSNRLYLQEHGCKLRYFDFESRRTWCIIRDDG